MKSVFTQIIALTLLSSTMVACSGQMESAKTSGTTQVRIPWYKENEGYSLQMVELTGLDSLYTVSGKFARFFFAPHINSDRLDGVTPKGRFLKIENGFVPANDISLQMAAIYASMQNFAALDEELGAGDVNKWPRNVGVGVVINGGLSNNAFYDGQTDSMLFVPYTDKKNLAIAVNAGILAHEHFHSLFHKIVVKPLMGTPAERFLRHSSNHDAASFYKLMGMDAPPTLPTQEDTAAQEETDVVLLPPPPRKEEDTVFSRPTSRHEARVYGFYHLALSRGFNEGLADFWAWIYTGDPDFITHSLPSVGKVRSLNAPANTFPNKQSVEFSMREILSYSSQKEGRLIGYSYRLGTSVSRILKSYTDIYAKSRHMESREARIEIGRMVIKALPELRAGFLEASESKSFLEPERFLRKVFSFTEDMTTEEKEFIEKTLLSSPSEKPANPPSSVEASQP